MIRVDMGVDLLDLLPAEPGDERTGGLLVQLVGQLLHALPRHEQRRADDQHGRSAEQQLALNCQ